MGMTPYRLVPKLWEAFPASRTTNEVYFPDGGMNTGEAVMDKLGRSLFRRCSEWVVIYSVSAVRMALIGEG